MRQRAGVIGVSQQKTHRLCNRECRHTVNIYLLGTIERVREETEENIRAERNAAFLSRDVDNV